MANPQARRSIRMKLQKLRCARGTDGKRLFCVSEFLTPQQVSSSFSRLATKLRQQQIDVTLQDALAAEEHINFSVARANVLSTLHIHHQLLLTSMTYVPWSTTNQNSRKRRWRCYSISVKVWSLKWQYRQ